MIHCHIPNNAQSVHRSIILRRLGVHKHTHKHTQDGALTCHTLVVHRVADDLVEVVLGPLPGEQHGGAGVGHGQQVARRAGQPLAHDHRQLGGGAGRAHAVVSDALVEARVLHGQLVDEQHAGALGLHAAEGADGLAIAQPVHRGRRLPGAVADEARRVAAGQGHRLRGLQDHRRGWWGRELTYYI